MTYSTQHEIKKKNLAGYQSPPLSHSSDITFLERQRACTKYKTDPKTLKHMFISVVKTPDTQQVVATILHSTGKPLTSWADLWGTQLPLWDQKTTFQQNSNEGRALLGTIQLKGIMWMLVQHREHLGKKAIRSISVFRDDLTGSNKWWDPENRGPSFYIELEDVQSGAGPSGSGPPGSGPSGSGKTGAGQSGSKHS